MPFQGVPFAAEAICRMTINSKPIVMTFYGTKLGGYGQADLEALAAAMDDWALNQLLSRLVTTATYDGFDVRGLQLENDFTATDISSAGAGVQASVALPNQNALAVKRRSALTGRSARGRVFVPLNEDNLQTNKNLVTQTTADTWVAALNEVKVHMATALFTEVIVSRITAGAPRVEGVTFEVVGYSVGNLNVDSQNRRGAV